MTIFTAPPPLLAGPPGQSAYSLAVSLGFSGSQAAWIASLQGQNGVGLTGPGGATGPGAVSVSQPFTGGGAINAATTYARVTNLPTGGLTLNLPAASSKQPGDSLTIGDETGTCSAAKPITITATGAGPDTISGQPSVILTQPYQRVTLVSNGSNLWLSP